MSLDRREFLARTTTGLSALAVSAHETVVRSASAAVRARSAPNERVDIGLIGAGGRGTFLMHRCLQQGDVSITAVCDVNEQHLARTVQALAEAGHPGAVQQADFRRLLDDDSLTAVIIATPHHWHAPIALRALEAGKHVYLEKPASHVFREGRLLIDAARRSGRVLQHGTQMRSSEVTAAAGEVLRSGLLGEIKQAKAWGVEPRKHPPAVPDSAPPPHLDYDRWLGPAPERPFNANRFQRWNSYRDYGNGEIGGDGVHDIDMARWGLGVTTHPVQITAQGSQIHVTGESDFPDNMLVTYQYAEGKVLIYENRNFAPYRMHGWDNGNIFYGTEGYMIFSRRGSFQTFLGVKEEPGPALQGSDGVDRHVRSFLDGIRGGTPAAAGAEVAHLSCGLVHLGEAAFRSGRVLQFDPERETVIDDEEANGLLTKQYRDPWGLEPGTA
jgi:predicted dehydrogenase